jgi:hypothetical protein
MIFPEGAASIQNQDQDQDQDHEAGIKAAGRLTLGASILAYAV